MAIYIIQNCTPSRLHGQAFAWLKRKILMLKMVYLPPNSEYTSEVNLECQVGHVTLVQWNLNCTLFPYKESEFATRPLPFLPFPSMLKLLVWGTMRFLPTSISTFAWSAVNPHRILFMAIAANVSLGPNSVTPIQICRSHYRSNAFL